MTLQNVLCQAMLAVTFLATGVRVADADIIVSVTPSAASYNVGDNGFLDVMISSNSSDALDSFFFGLNISGGPGVVFAGSQTEAFLTDPDYVFLNRSANVNQLLLATSTGSGGSTISVGDVSYDTTSMPPGDSLPFVLPGVGFPALIARIEFNTISAGAFSVDVDPSSSFSDFALNEFDFTSTGASFNVSSVAVPEPGTLTLLCVSGVIAGVMKRRRIKANATLKAGNFAR